MNMPELLAVVALILALVEEFRDRGQLIVGWAVVFLSIAALWGKVL